MSSTASSAARTGRQAAAALAVAFAIVGTTLMMAAGGPGVASAETGDASAVVRQSDPPTGNGTIRVHSPGTTAGDTRHERRVCSFYLAAFDFEPDVIAWRIESPGGDVVAQDELRLDADGHGSTGVMRLPDGRYELSWTASAASISPENDSDRSFTVECSGQAGPPGPQPPGPPGPGGPGGGPGGPDGWGPGGGAGGQDGPGAGGPGGLGAGGHNATGGTGPGEAGTPGNGDALGGPAGDGGRSGSSPGDGSGDGGKVANPASPPSDSWSGVRLPAADDPVLAAAMGTGAALILTAGLVVAFRRLRRGSRGVAVATGEDDPATRYSPAVAVPDPPAEPPLPPLPPLPRRVKTSMRSMESADLPGPSREGDDPPSG